MRKMLEIKDSVAVTTGGAMGIGKCVATFWVQNGGKVVLGDMAQQALEQTKAELGAMGGKVATVVCNVTKEDHCARRGLADKIRCVAIAPGYVATPMVSGMNQKALDKILADVPIGRLVEPEEVAQLVGDLYRNEAVAGEVYYIHADPLPTTGLGSSRRVPIFRLRASVLPLFPQAKKGRKRNSDW
jgi:NAD(P)-dependent dehydrogenase (short-subunit alcohol dehydrogenase family)